jgi:hypothetical protein
LTKRYSRRPQVFASANSVSSITFARSCGIIDRRIRGISKLARLANIQAPILGDKGDDDILVPTVNSYLLTGDRQNTRLTI